MLIRWIIGSLHSAPVAKQDEEAQASVTFQKKRAPSGLDSLFPSGAYKPLLQILCTDDRHCPWQGDWSSKANGLPIVGPEGRRKAEEEEEGGRLGWCLLLSEWANCSRTGGREPKHAPQGNHNHLFPPNSNQHHHSQQHGPILTRQAGLPLAIYVAPCSPQSNPQTLTVSTFMTVWTVH